MKKILLFIAIAVCSVFADGYTEVCNSSGVETDIPNNTCTVWGRVTDIAYATTGVQYLAFHLKDENGNDIQTSISGTSKRLRGIYYIEDLKQTDALGTIMTSTLGLSAFNSNTDVNIIYKIDPDNVDDVFVIAIMLAK